MRVLDLMTRDVAVLPGDARLFEAVRLLAERRISSVIVRPSREDVPWGIVTHRDIVSKVAARGLDPSEVRIDSVMRPAFLLVDPSLNVGHASRLMRRFGVRHLLVLEGSRPAGILSYHDVLSLFTLLRRVPFFSRLAADDLAALLNLASLRRCPKDTVLIREGEEDRSLFLLESGELVVSTKRAGRIARIREGEIVGEVELFGGTRSATVRTARPSTVIVIDGERFTQLALRREHLGAVVFESMSRLLSRRLRRANRSLFLRGIWSHRAYVLRAALVSAGVFVALVLGTATVSETPSLCPSCHNMQPYHATWTTSAHREIRCTTCHWSYGLRGAVRGKITGVAMVVRYATKTYDPKPVAKVPDSSCLRSGCHTSQARAPRFEVDGAPDVAFSHAAHLAELAPIGMPTCTSCHNHRGQKVHFSVEAATCNLCHFASVSERVTPCRGCHDFDARAGAAVVRLDHTPYRTDAECHSCHGDASRGRIEVEPSRCNACHLDVEWLATPEMHHVHVREELVDCFDCHSEIEHPGSREEDPVTDCEACHVDSHEPQKRLYAGEAGAGVRGRPALMQYFQVKCTACHGVDVAGRKPDDAPPTPGPSAERSCIRCHETDMDEETRAFVSAIEELDRRVRTQIDRVEARLRSGGAAADTTAERLYEEALSNYSFVTADASAAIHNFRYAQDLLRAAEESSRRALEILEARKRDVR